MVWSDGVPLVFKGVRTFVLTPRGKSSTDFMMEERFSGAMFALTKRLLPDFRPIFEAYASDLKREAEANGQVTFSDADCRNRNGANTP